MREPNIVDLEEFRRDFHNPLFRVIPRQFDNVFQESEVSDDWILDKLYVDERERGQVTNTATVAALNGRPKEVGKVSDVTRQLSRRRGTVYLLIGKKGIGKTVLLKRFCRDARTAHPGADAPLVVYLDLMNLWEDAQFLEALPGSLSTFAYDYVKNEVPWASRYFTDPDAIRQLDDGYARVTSDDLLLKTIWSNPVQSVENLFRWITKSGREVFLVVDNIDDFAVADIRVLLAKCRDYKDRLGVRCIVALRDYLHPRGLGIDDRHLSSYHLRKPHIYKVIQRRLQAVDTSAVDRPVELRYGRHTLELTARDLIACFDAIANQLISASSELHQRLFALANYNTREHLLNLYHFFHSPYLFSRPLFIETLITKIREATPEAEFDPVRETHFFDFLECFMAIHCLCYDTEESQIFNLFQHDFGESEFTCHNTLIFLRILQSLPRSRRRGFKRAAIVRDLECVGYPPDAVDDALSLLLKAALVESADGITARDVSEVYLSAKGLTYLKHVIPEFTYLMFVCDAVAMEEQYRVPVIEKFGNEKVPLSRGNLERKIESVHKFLDFVRNEERAEEQECPARYLPVLRRIRGPRHTTISLRAAVQVTVRTLERQRPRRFRPVQVVTVVAPRDNQGERPGA